MMHSKVKEYFVYDFDWSPECEDVMIKRVEALSPRNAIRICMGLQEPDFDDGEDDYKFIGYCDREDVGINELRIGDNRLIFDIETCGIDCDPFHNRVTVVTVNQETGERNEFDLQEADEADRTRLDNT